MYTHHDHIKKKHTHTHTHSGLAFNVETLLRIKHALYWLLLRSNPNEYVFCEERFSYVSVFSNRAYAVVLLTRLFQNWPAVSGLNNKNNKKWAVGVCLFVCGLFLFHFSRPMLCRCAPVLERKTSLVQPSRVVCSWPIVVGRVRIKLKKCVFGVDGRHHHNIHPAV